MAEREKNDKVNVHGVGVLFYRPEEGGHYKYQRSTLIERSGAGVLVCTVGLVMGKDGKLTEGGIRSETLTNVGVGDNGEPMRVNIYFETKAIPYSASIKHTASGSLSIDPRFEPTDQELPLGDLGFHTAIAAPSTDHLPSNCCGIADSQHEKAVEIMVKFMSTEELALLDATPSLLRDGKIGEAIDLLRQATPKTNKDCDSLRELAEKLVAMSAKLEASEPTH